MFRRVRTAARAAVAAIGRVPAAVLCVAFLSTAVMYCANDNRDPRAFSRALAAGAGRPVGASTYRPQLARGDGHMHYLITRSIVFDRDFDFDNDLAKYGDPWRQPPTVTGKKNVMQQIGPSLIWAPVLAFAHGVSRVANVFGAEVADHGYTLFHQRIVFATSVLFAWLAIALGIVVVRRHVGGRWGPVLAGVAALLGTTLTYYATFMPAYAHAMDAAACAGFLALWALTLGDLRWRRFVWLGVLLGIATMVRIQDIGFGVVVALELAQLAWQALRRRDRAAVLGLVLRGGLALAIALVMYTPQLVVWKDYYGSYFTTPQGPGQMRYAHPMVLELLFSSRNGWLSTHPIAYLGTLGLVVGVLAGPRLGKHVRLVCGAMLLAIVFQIYVNAVTYEWWSAASFGQRRMASVTLPIVVGLATLLRFAHTRIARLRARPRVQLAIAFGVLGYLVAWNLAWVSRLGHGAPAGRDNRATCCGDVPAPLSWIARPVYAVAGNPFALPASAVFSIEHGVDLRRWDAAVGNYALVPGVLGYTDGSYRRATATWNVLDARYLLDGWSAQDRFGSRSWRWTTDDRATLLLPLLMPEPHRITLPIAANVRPGDKAFVQIGCNGKLVATAFVGPQWSSITFDTDGTVGESTIEIVALARPYAATGVGLGAPRPPAHEPVVGVAIAPFRVALP